MAYGRKAIANGKIDSNWRYRMIHWNFYTSLFKGTRNPKEKSTKNVHHNEDDKGTADKEQVHEPSRVTWRATKSNKRFFSIYKMLYMETCVVLFCMLTSMQRWWCWFWRSTTRSFSFDTFIFGHFFILLSSQLFFPLVRWCHTKYICFDVPFFGLSFACMLVFFVCFTRGIVFRLGHQFVCKS